MIQRNLSACLMSVILWGGYGSSVAQERPAAAQEKKPNRSQFVSDASYIVATYQPAFGKHSPQEMAAAANRFLETLDDELQAKVRYKIDSRERRLWTNLPAAPDAGGVRFGEMNEKQIRAACDLMATLYSKKGYQRAIDIMIADDQLLPQGQRRQGIGTEDFSVVLFGKPDPEEPWAFQIDGHHLGSNVAIQGDRLTMSPSFIGTQPEAFTITHKVRPMGGETDDVYRLLGSLNESQKEKAVVGQRRGQLMTGPGRDGQIPRAIGLTGADLSDEQKKMLLRLIGNWVNDMPEKHAKREMKRIGEGLDETCFAWRGPVEFGGSFSYIIQGPAVIIEHTCQLDGRNPREHMHSMYRDPTNEYGGQLKKRR